MKPKRVYVKKECVHCHGLKFIAAQGLCRACYYRQRSTGTLDYQPQRIRRTCEVEDCGRPMVSYGRCDSHRIRDRRKKGTVKQVELLMTPKAIASREYRKLNPQKRDFMRSKNNDLKKAFGITLERYNEMLEKQNGVCAICGKKDERVHNATGRPMNLAVDHCHNSKKVRALLCGPCNTGLGGFNDDVKLLRAAAAYLEQHGEEEVYGLTPVKISGVGVPENDGLPAYFQGEPLLAELEAKWLKTGIGLVQVEEPK